MADERIKVPGYVKKITYNGNIEYRNFSPDLVGLQLTSEGGTPLFTLGNFNITTNLDPKLDKTFLSKQFSDFVTLDGLNLTVSQTDTLLNNNAKVFLNIDKSKLSYYATFGSLTEFIRVALENIIINWPASILMHPIKVLSTGEQLVGNTFENYSYNEINNIGSFKIPTNFITNRYNINYLTNGDISGTFNESNTLRNMVSDYKSYALLLNGVEYNVVGFTGTTSNINNYIYFEVENNPFTATSGNMTYHIKPKNVVCDEFFNNLDEFEYYLLNRQSYPIYTATFKYPLRTDFGVLLYTEKTITWPTTDGYNLDYETTEYQDYATTLFELSNDNDLINTNIMARFLVSESITGFDTLPYFLSDEDQDTSGGKVNKLLNIYGNSFDEINRYVEGLSFANTVSYNKLDNTPDVYLKNIARVMGWELIEPIITNNLLTDYVQTTQSSFSGESVSLTPVEADVELWRRLILNTPWLWKSKGTRKGVEFLLRFIGTPNGLITFNEYVYKVDKPIDIELFKTVLELNSLDSDLSNYPIDTDGYPRFLENSDDMYFQGNGLWYRETSGVNSILDITSGNNPHVGPYDGGNKYFNQLRTLIPDFTPVTITSSTTTTTSEDLFTNYNTGEITDYTGELYVDVEHENGLELSDCFTYVAEIITDPKPESIINDCGCEVNSVYDESLSICIERKQTTPQRDCDFTVKLSEEAGYYIFTANYNDSEGNNTSNSYETLFVNRECCSGVLTGGLGLPIYNDAYVGDLPTSQTDPLIQSGYACCKAETKCSCHIARDWVITPEPTILNGEKYIQFITLGGLGNPVLVGTDPTICPPEWTSNISNITDPNTGLIGIGCKLTADGLSNYQVLYDAYQIKLVTDTGCTFGFPPIPTDPIDPIDPIDPSLTCVAPTLLTIIPNLINNDLAITWDMNVFACNGGQSIVAQYSLDNISWVDLPINGQPNLNNGIATVSNISFVGLGLVYFRIIVQYQIGLLCLPPYLDCYQTSNVVNVEFGATLPVFQEAPILMTSAFISGDLGINPFDINSQIYNLCQNPITGLRKINGLNTSQKLFTVGDFILHQDNTPFVGNNRWRAFMYQEQPSVKYICRISNIGRIEEVAWFNCNQIP